MSWWTASPHLNTLLITAVVSAIAGLQRTADCYKYAIDLLQTRFGDERVIVQDHVLSLLDLKPVFSYYEARPLRNSHDEVQGNMRSLKALGINSTTYCSMQREVLLRTLPSDMVLHFHELHKPSTLQLPSLT